MKPAKEPEGVPESNRTQTSRSFLADADRVTPHSTDGYGSPWAMWKPRWVFEAWERAVGGEWPRQQRNYYDDLKTAFELYRFHGEIDERTKEGALFSLLRPGPVARFSAQERERGEGKPVDRALAWTTGIQYTDPFYKLVGARLIVLIAHYTKNDPEARFHAHLGEEYVCILQGKVKMQWRVPVGKRKEFTTAEQVLDSKQNSREPKTAWFKSECAHRAVLLSESATLLVFYSDPLGAIILHPWFRTWSKQDKQQGLGSKYVEANAPPEREWAIFSGIGARIERVRRQRGWSIKQLATIAGIEPSHLNRIEDGKITPSIETAARLAANLDAPLSEILPDDVLSYINGSYTNTADPVWRMFTDESMPEVVSKMLSSKRKSEGKDQRVQIPYIWKDYGELLVLPAGSPRAKSLLPVQLHIAKPEKDRPLSKSETIATGSPRALANRNYDALQRRKEEEKLWSHDSNLIVFVRRGNIRLRVCRFSDMQLFPFLGSQAPEDAKGWFEPFELSEGDLVHLNCAHLHRFEIPYDDDKDVPKDYYCELLCVIGRRHVSDAIQTPTVAILDSVLPVREDDSDFWHELLKRRRHKRK